MSGVWLVLVLFIAATNGTKLCTNCKHFIPGNNQVSAKCKLFPKLLEFSPKNLIKKRAHLVNYLVSGVPPKSEQNYLHCTTARGIDCMCGIDGKLYEETGEQKKQQPDA
jgi:hypothetical protein